MTEAPPLETERLVLVGHTLDDLPDCEAMWTRPEVTQFTIGRVSTPQETWHRMLRYAGHWPLLGYGVWAAREKRSNRYAGALGFFDGKRGLDANLGALPELGYVLAPWCHGQGFASEAVRAVVNWGDAHLLASRTWCLIRPEATASLRVAEKCGYAQLDRVIINDHPTLVLDRPRSPRPYPSLSSGE